jgi:multiple sugar transport system ATP-binding protein
LFVAGFIGSPAMNFVLADFAPDDGPAVGVRPSDFEDASFGEATWARMPVTVGVNEELGTEIHVIFTVDAPPVEHASLASAADHHDEEDDTVAALAGGKSLWTARVSARSTVRAGQPLELAVDTRRFHFFDPSSGQTIGYRLKTGGAVSA